MKQIKDKLNEVVTLLGRNDGPKLLACQHPDKRCLEPYPRAAQKAVSDCCLPCLATWYASESLRLLDDISRFNS